jgi:iron complex transport system substrate-binding protein
MRILTVILVAVVFLTVGCRNNPDKKYSGENGSRYTVKYADRFSLARSNNYTILSVINPWQGAVGVNQKYYLVKRGEEPPETADPSSVIFVPVRKIICMSTTYLPMIKEMGGEKSIVGISGSNLIFDEKIRERIFNGEVTDIGYEDNLNKEVVIRLSPDIIMVYGVGSEASGYINKLRDLGIKVMFNADYLEEDPIAKAEWIKVFGALYCREEYADSVFNSIVSQYDSIKAAVNSNISVRPKVLLGLPWKDTWYVSPGNSFISRLIEDAGGDYLWSETKSEISLPYGVENVWVRAREADFWLNISTAGKKDEILNVDYRLGDLPVFKNGNLYNNNKRVALNGGNDYWESGSLYPQVILKDIAAILHPEIFQGYDLFYYKKIN